MNWNDIQTRATKFAQEWKKRGYEKGETQIFYKEFFDLFGMDVKRVAQFEHAVKKLGDKQGFIDLFWTGMLLVEQKSEGRDLTKALDQAYDYFHGLADIELPKYLLVSDFQNFHLYNLESKEAVHFTLAELPENIRHFAFIAGYAQEIREEQERVNIKAAELMGNLHDLLYEDGFKGEKLQILLIRLVFCLFAENTGIFELDLFLKLIKNHTKESGDGLGQVIAKLFQVLNKPEDERQTSLHEDFAAFPYVNGGLFEQTIEIPDFNRAMRDALLKACHFDWKEVSPAIFGSLFQSVMDTTERREQGAHYTSEENILKVINPLFLEELWQEFNKNRRLKGEKSQRELRKFHKKLSSLQFMDPACGCGNFLVITYQKLRDLETALLQELYSADQQHLNVAQLSLIDVDKFYGIELGEFPAKIAQVALWMTDHLANIELSHVFGQYYSRIPLRKSPNITCTDALEVDWQKLLPPKKCSYILGNPPFIGAKYQSAEQRKQIINIAKLGKSGGTLDYVCSWFLKASEYVQKNKAIKIGFVSTNSITQGEQVAQLWPLLFDRYKMRLPLLTALFRGRMKGEEWLTCILSS